MHRLECDFDASYTRTVIMGRDVFIGPADAWVRALSGLNRWYPLNIV